MRLILYLPYIRRTTIRIMLKSRLEGIISATNPEYKGSITIPKELMDANNILENEQVHVLNKNNGNRFITYAIPGKGICLNGAAARMGMVGDTVILLTYHII